jgi:AcrR family transcriptional regulator
MSGNLNKDVVGQSECVMSAAMNAVQQQRSTDARVDKLQTRKGAGEDPAKRNQILDGARKVFTRMGFDAASMNDITKEAGVSKGTIYVYFENKEELFGALIARQRDLLFTDLRQVLDEGGPIEETLSRYGYLLATQLLAPDVIMAQRAVIGIVGRMPEMGRNFYMNGPRFGHGLLRDWLQKQVDGGLMAVPNIEIAASQLVELCMAGQMRARLFGAISGDPEPEEIRAIVDSGVRVFCRSYLL